MSEGSISSQDSFDSTVGEADSMETSAGKGDNAHCEPISDVYLESSIHLEEGRSGGHRAGFDAFMTGFVMACILSKHTSVENVENRMVGAGIELDQLSGVEKFTNKIYAAGKDQPMIISKSNFCVPSKEHQEKLKRLRHS